MQKVLECIARQHDPRLVALAVLICVLGSVTAISLLLRGVAVTCRPRGAWIAGAAVAFGGSMWTTHFLAMLAYVPAVGLRYSVQHTGLSLLLAISGSFVAFLLALRGPPTGWSVTLGGLVLGGAIGAMHFTGIAALRPAQLVSVAPAYIVAALAAGAAFGLASLVAVRLLRPTLAAACAVLAVCGLHFVAIAGTVVTQQGGPHDGIPELAGRELAASLTAITVLVLSLALLGAIIDRHLAERTQAEAGRLRRFADASFEGILFLRNGVVIDANAAVCALFGRQRAALLGRPLGALLQLPAPSGAITTDGTAEADLVDATGHRRPVELLSRSLGGAADTDCVVAVRDLTDRKQAEERIQYLAHHDGLTGLSNRVLFRDRLTHALSVAERTGHGLALLCLDLDGFKAVNDLLGHPVGDLVLIEAANRMAVCLRDSDTVARLGGDEFAIVQSFSEQPRGAAGLADRVVRLLAEPFEVGGHRVDIGTSVGIALYPSDAHTPETLLRNADLALYRAKHDGRGVYRFFEQQMDERLQQRRVLEQDLRGAMLRDELRLHYQPLRDSATLQVDGFEALLRWQHPRRGMVSPAEFVPVAEECGLIGAVGEWVLETACAEAASWTSPWRVAVNLSPLQFRQPHLAETVRDVLARCGLPASRLELEITEGILIDDAERALATLRQLKSLGVQIALDDFGTGYSSLSYLRRFPFDRLKIDASFVQALGDGGEADAIVRAIVALGRSLGLYITAEGVETPDQLTALRAQACDQVQGFLLGRPMPPVDIRRLFAPMPAPA